MRYGDCSGLFCLFTCCFLGSILIFISVKSLVEPERVERNCSIVSESITSYQCIGFVKPPGHGDAVPCDMTVNQYHYMVQLEEQTQEVCGDQPCICCNVDGCDNVRVRGCGPVFVAQNTSRCFQDVYGHIYWNQLERDTADLIMLLVLGLCFVLPTVIVLISICSHCKRRQIQDSYVLDRLQILEYAKN